MHMQYKLGRDVGSLREHQVKRRSLHSLAKDSNSRGQARFVMMKFQSFGAVTKKIFFRVTIHLIAESRDI